MAPQRLGQAGELRRAPHGGLVATKASIQVSPEADKRRIACDSGEVTQVPDDVRDARSALTAEVPSVEAHAHDPLAATNLGDDGILELPLTWVQGAGAGVGGHHRALPGLQ